jgi:hypothetical protein
MDPTELHRLNHEMRCAEALQQWQLAADLCEQIIALHRQFSHHGLAGLHHDLSTYRANARVPWYSSLAWGRRAAR